jgi:TonB family protein
MNWFRILALSTAGAVTVLAQDTAAPATNARLYETFQDGVIAIQNHEWDAAIDKLNEAARIDPAQGTTWARLGEAYYGLARDTRGADSNGALRRSADAYGKAVERMPDDAGYHNGYAMSLAALGRFDEMQPEMEKAAKLDPVKAAQYYYTFGGILLSSGHPEDAASALGKAAKAAPGIPDIYFPYASALASQAKIVDGKAVLPPDAVEAFRTYLKLAPNAPFAAVVKDALAVDGTAVETTFGEAVAEKPGAPKALSIGGNVQMAKLTSRPQPVYPPLARRLRIAGTVSIDALIGEEGKVLGLAVESANPLLVSAALSAVKQWTYKPTLLNGQPVRVRTRIDVTFNPAGTSGR